MSNTTQQERASGRGRLTRERARPPLSDEVVQESAEILASLDDRIEAVALFGSYVRGRVRGCSDLDLAVVMAHGSEPVSLDLRGDWQETLSLRLKGYPVDVIALDGESLLLYRNISREGRLLLERRPGAWREFQRRTTHEWRDRAQVRERYWQRFLKRWDERGFGERYEDHTTELEQMRRVSQALALDQGGE